MLHKNLFFRRLENGKLIFCSVKMNTPFGDIVCHYKIHTCAQYGAIITNYSLVKVITKLIVLESHATSNIEGHLWGHFFKIIAVFQVYLFQWKLGYIKWQNAKDFHFLFSFNFWGQIQDVLERVWLPFVAMCWFLQNSCWISD